MNKVGAMGKILFIFLGIALILSPFLVSSLSNYTLYLVGGGILIIILAFLFGRKKFASLDSRYNRAAERNLGRRLGPGDLQKVRAIR